MSKLKERAKNDLTKPIMKNDTHYKFSTKTQSKIDKNRFFYHKTPVLLKTGVLWLFCFRQQRFRQRIGDQQVRHFY